MMWRAPIGAATHNIYCILWSTSKAFYQRQNLSEISKQSKNPGEGFHQTPLYHNGGVTLLVGLRVKQLITKKNLKKKIQTDKQKFRLERDWNSWPLRYLCRALSICQFAEISYVENEWKWICEMLMYVNCGLKNETMTPVAVNAIILKSQCHPKCFLRLCFCFETAFYVWLARSPDLFANYPLQTGLLASWYVQK